ncbi:hypothetical protein BH09MYX1_BH09MYX1_03650 [soil metagenome]
MRDLVPCNGCKRLHRLRDAACPFCFAVRVIAFAAILPLSVACQKSVPAAADAAAESTTTTASAAATSSDVVPLPALSASASATPSAIASAQRAAIGRDAGPTAEQQLLAMFSADASAGIGNVFGDSGLASLQPGIAAYGGPGISAYGAAPSPGLGAITGNVAVVTSGGHTANDDRIVAMRRPAFRACYTRGLLSNPDMSGKLKLHVTVAADGTASAQVASESGALSSDVKQCITTTMSRAMFEANAHAFDVEVTATTK